MSAPSLTYRLSEQHASSSLNTLSAGARLAREEDGTVTDLSKPEILPSRASLAPTGSQMMLDSAVSGLLAQVFRDPIQARVLSIQLGHTFKDGTYEANLYDLSFPVIGESGNYPVRTIARLGEECRYFRIDPALMPEADNSDGE